LKVQISGKNGPKVIDLNRRRAIRERCLNCSSWFLKEVTHCEMKDCHLFPYRSGQGKQNATARKKSIRQYCLWCTCNQPKEIRLCPAKDCPLYAYRMMSVDRSVEIKSESKIDYMEPVFQTKKETECQSIA
jgi:hypothetical protein